MIIACLSIPRFAVEVERQRRRDGATSLILIGDATVFDCSLGAEASGVQHGMRMSEAIGLCHRALVLAPDRPHYQSRFEEVLDLLQNYSPVVEPGNPSTGSGQALGSAYLSLGGLQVEPAFFADNLIADLHRRLGFMASVGVARGKFTARVLAETTRQGLAKVIPPGRETVFLSPLPVEHLPLSETVRERLRLLGLETMGDIARLPLGAFQQQFGPGGKRIWELARGIDVEPLAARTKQELIMRRLELPAPTVSLEAIFVGLQRLVYSAYESAELKGRHVRQVVARAQLDGGGSWELPVAFREALANPADAWFAVKSAVERHLPSQPVEELGVELRGLSGESGKQLGLFEEKGKLWRQIEEAARQLKAQQGEVSLGRIVELEPWSRIPERRMGLAEFDL